VTAKNKIMRGIRVEALDLDELGGSKQTISC